MLGKRRRFEDNMSEELRFHIEEYTADLVRSGVPADEAARRARIEFGGVEAVKEECRESRQLHILDELWRNARYATRVLLKNPRFTTAALAPLALCLGANLAIFAVLDSVLLRPLPFPEAHRLVVLFKTYPKVGVLRDGASATNYYERRGHIPAFESIAMLRSGGAIVGEPGSTERAEILQVTADFFSTLGRLPLAGRAFTEEEMTYPADRVAIIAGDPKMLGRQLRMNGVARTVVGVLPADFRFLSSEARLFVPLPSAPEERRPADRHSGRGGELIARLRPGATIEEAQQQIDALDAATAHEYPRARMIADAGYRTRVAPLHADHVAAVRPTLLLLQAGVFFLLLIGAVNLVNLLLLRASGRVKELAVRLAMGAGRRHVITEVMVETMLLTTLGGALGLAVGAVGIRLLATLGLEHLPLAGAGIAFDGRLAAVALLASLVIGAVVGFPIAWFHIRGQLGVSLQSETRGGTAHRAAQRLRHAFLVAQITFAFVLLAGAGLLGLSFQKVAQVSVGFPPDHVLSGRISLPWSNYAKNSARLDFTAKLVEEMGRQPGVSAAGVVTNLPLTGNNTKSAIAVKDRPARAGELPLAVYAYSVDGDYFRAMRYRLLEGRYLTSADSRRADRVCVIDEDFARQYWPNGGAIGHVLFLGGGPHKDAEGYAIAGVVGAVKQADLTERDSHGAVYFPIGHRADTSMYLVARTSLAPEFLASAFQQTVRAIDPELPVYDVRSIEARIAVSLAPRRAPALLAGIFAAVALLLAALGTYGVLSYAISQRRREIGVRMALGARPSQIGGQFLAAGLRLLAAGTLLGVIGAWLAGRAMQNLLFGVPALHVPTLLGAAVLMSAIVLAACLLPSRQAARISPMEALATDQ
jgi:predicted permease